MRGTIKEVRIGGFRKSNNNLPYLVVHLDHPASRGYMHIPVDDTKKYKVGDVVRVSTKVIKPTNQPTN